MRKTVEIDVQELYRGRSILLFEGNNVTFEGKLYTVDSVPELREGKHIYLRLYTPGERMQGSFSITGQIISIH